MFNLTYLPYSFMVHTLDHYSVTYTKENGAQVASYTLTAEEVPCCVQNSTVEIIDEYKQREDKVTEVAYLLNKNVYDVIKIKDRIVCNSHNYQIAGKVNIQNLNKLFRLDLEVEID